MDVAGAGALQWRLAEQEQWRRARAVRVGLQPAVDPDHHALESFRGLTRYYRAEQRVEVVEGRSELVTRRFCKLVVEGVWESQVVVEDVRRIA